ELLQNAEDMNATVVRFILGKKGIDFEHNGAKRSFNVADIDAITNIGHNRQKKDDPTSIGKFGVGFKAVFAYTSTPIIHSGNYHFKIIDYFVPEFEGVKIEDTIDSEGVPWTKFSFPFNNPKKPASVAYEECFEGLKTLDSSAILFLQSIRKIEYMLPSGDYGYVERIDQESHHVTVVYQRPTDQKESTSKWLRFHKLVDITDDQGKPKKLSIAVAFALDYDGKTKKKKIVPVKGGGRTFIYFPAEKEHSGLRFHINAPFASTVARDSVRNCEDNKKLIKAISQMIVDNLPEVKAQGLMNHAFFEVLPNSKDDLNFFYQYIFDYVYVAFQKNEYLPTKDDGFVTSTAALMGPAAISNLLKGDDLKSVTGIEKIWIANASQKNSHADNFIQSLGIETYTYKDFVKIFDAQCRTRIENLLSEKNQDWLKRFYVLCADAYDDMVYSGRAAFVRNMKQTVMIKSAKGAMYTPADIFILPKNTTLITKTTPIVDQSMVLSDTKNDRISERIKSFFQGRLDIREYGPKVEVEKLLQKYDDEYEPNDEYFKDLLSFAKYKANHNDIDFSSHSLFLYLNNSDNKLYRIKADKLFLGKAYGNNAGELLANVYEKNCLWDGYADHYNEKELQQFITFVISCGAHKGLSIEEQSACWHPLYHSELSADGRRHTGYGSNSDYMILGLKKLLEVQSIKISKLIWKTLERYGKSGGYKYIKARYSPNASATTKTCDSSLIYYLKQYAWIPDKQGKLHRPEDISVSELRGGFSYDPENKILEALKLGSAAEKKNQKQAELEREAKEAGMVLISEEDYALLQRTKAQ
ncbi:MAG: sacsin N-terminal ATP-binding-like domain-containing protein, partial [Agathobacter sp.]